MLSVKRANLKNAPFFKRLGGRIALGLKSNFTKQALKRATQAHYGIIAAQKETADKYQRMCENAPLWKKLHQVDSNSETIQNFKLDKQLKWEQKISNIKLAKVKLACELALSIALLAVTVATIALTMLGLGFAFPVLMALGSAAIVLGVAGLALLFFKKYAQPQPAYSVPLPITR